MDENRGGTPRDEISSEEKSVELAAHSNDNLSEGELSVAEQFVKLRESRGTDAAELHHWLQL